jgi:hypothetical protein
MKENYKGHIILITARHPAHSVQWKPTCKVISEQTRRLIKNLDWSINYESSAEAERVGLLIAKKWIDEGKPNL